MTKYEVAKESIFMWFAIMILVGIVLILLGKLPNVESTVKETSEFVGITFVGVVAVFLMYERSIAEKHFKDFKRFLASELKEIDPIQSKCMKLGINEKLISLFRSTSLLRLLRMARVT